MSKKNKSSSPRSFKLKTREQEQSQRQMKVSQAINASLVDCFVRGSKLDPRLASCQISITKVNISRDLRSANCFFLPFNTSLSKEDILEALEESKYAIREHVTRMINLKYSPELVFYYDVSFENAMNINELIKK